VGGPWRGVTASIVAIAVSGALADQKESEEGYTSLVIPVYPLLVVLAFALGAPQDDDKHLASELVERLGSDELEVREEAARRLQALGRATEPALRKALHSQDPEVASRARRILSVIPLVECRAILKEPLRSLLEGRVILDSDVILWMLLPHDYLLARWWVNGQPFVPKEDQGAYMAMHNGAFSELRTVDLRLVLKFSEIGARTGDHVDLQVLFSSDGWDWVTNDLEIRWPSGPAGYETPPLLRLSNRASLVVP
jgi:hypothetical protein